MIYRNARFCKILAVFVLINFISQILFPLGAYALTAGPNQPEFSSFTPVSSTEMVNLFTGDFNYNIPVIEVPGADGGGYALSLSYNSGVTSETEASWVGFGWTLNPGAINHIVRGFPDDYNGDKVKYYNKTPPNWTSTIGKSVGIEAFSADIPLALSISNSLRFNNYYGYTKDTGLGITAKGIGSLNMNFDNDGVTFRPSINPLKILNDRKKDGVEKSDEHTLTLIDNKQGGFGLAAGVKIKQDAISTGISSSAYGLFTHSESAKALNFSEYYGKAFNWSASVQVNTVVPVGLEKGHQGGFSLQYNKYKKERSVYGYLNLDKAGNKEAIMDYYTEKESPFDKRDVFLGMPFSNADQYAVSGEGINGGFRSYLGRLSDFKPNEYESTININQLGAELSVGANVGIGVDIGVGRQSNRMTSWATPVSSFSGLSDAKFRFNHDLGGKIMYTSKVGLERGNVQLLGRLPGTRHAIIIPTQSESKSEGEDRSGTYKLLNAEVGQSSFIHPIVQSGKINGFQITNEQGATYSYGESIKVRNETNISVHVKRGTAVQKRYLTFSSLSLGRDAQSGHYDMKLLGENIHQTVVGQISNSPYSGSHLITAIKSPTYVDADKNNIPSDGDYGGWTKFDYQTVYGVGKNKWYRYRTPYAGLLYAQNNISDTKDDLGSVVTGEKEIKYLKSIETKTHVAYFITNKSDFTSITGLADAPFMKGISVSDPATARKDGIGAKEVGDTEDPAAKGSNVIGDTELEYLDKIVLFAKSPTGVTDWNTPIKVVRFAYDYSLVPNLPNNSASTFSYLQNVNSRATQTGKLTLKKVWFEYNGTYPAKISPYKFEYNYPTANSYLKNHELFAEYARLPENVQNPVYSPYLLGPWGYPIGNAESRKSKGIPWVDQSAILQGEEKDYYEEIFDPAAWHLKKIDLPSGGQIHVQYEEKDYTSVQGRDAMVMARLVEDGSKEPEYNGEFATYHVNISDFGIDPTLNENNALIMALRDKIEAHFLNNSEKIYFKFLYALKGNNPSIDDCRSEYISGYGTFSSVEIEEVKGIKTLKISLKNTSGSASRGTIPRQACFELVSNQKQGKLDNSDCVNGYLESLYEPALITLANKQGESSEIKDLAKISLPAMTLMIGRLGDPSIIDKKEQVCLRINPNYSFLKLPMITAKKGGGARVKRLLFYDKGLEMGDPSIFGTRYHYRMEDGSSSGVATNEPAPAREENPLVKFIAKKEQGFLSRITAGEDKEQSEGPLGESLLPGASIGHRRVVVQNINAGSSGNGYSVHEFHTCHEYPYDGNYNAIASESKNGVEKTGIQKEIDLLKIPAGLFNFSTSKLFSSQGFRFLMNSMHGQMKSVANYSGTFNPESGALQSSYLVSQQEYHYFEPGEKIRMFGWDSDNGVLKDYLDEPGTEMDMAFASKKVVDRTLDLSIELDISITISFPPPIFVTVFPSFSMAENILATHATTKVIRYPAIMKGKTSYQDGIYHREDYMAFNEQTGKPVLTRNTDSYHGVRLAEETHNGGIYNLTVPAAWMYEAMGPKFKNAEYSNELNAQTASFTTYGVEPNAEWFADPTKLLSASVQTFDNDWFSTGSNSWPNSKIQSDYAGIASNTTALNKIWRPKASYIYKSSNLLVSNAAEKVYNSGFFNIQNQFDWAASQNNQPQPDGNWAKSSEIVHYSPNGEPLEEKNILDIHSAALFKPSNSHHLPSMVAANATYGSIYFEDYEYRVTPDFGVSHSGFKASKVLLNDKIISGIQVNEHLIREGGVAMLWINFLGGVDHEDMQLNLGGSVLNLTKVAKTGEWILMSSTISGSIFESIGVGNNIEISLGKGDGVLSTATYIDDVRFQPNDAEASCYIYDINSLRLLAKFDDQHFGVYYQYNAEGQLISQSVETERGVKTIRESQYHQRKELR